MSAHGGTQPSFSVQNEHFWCGVSSAGLGAVILQQWCQPEPHRGGTLGHGQTGPCGIPKGPRLGGMGDVPGRARRTLPACPCPAPRLEEGSRRKCGQYWPLEKDFQVCFGALTITNLGIENLNHYKKTILEIHSSEVRGHSCLVGEWHGGTRGQRRKEGITPLLSPDQGAAAGVPLPVPELARLWRPLFRRHSHRLFGGCEAAAEGGCQRPGTSLQGPPWGTPSRGALQRWHWQDR